MNHILKLWIDIIFPYITMFDDLGCTSAVVPLCDCTDGIPNGITQEDIRFFGSKLGFSIGFEERERIQRNLYTKKSRQIKQLVAKSVW
jgi:hypothetical protein